MPALEDLITAGDVADGTHSHSGADITSGTVADARIAATIARDSEITTDIATHAAIGAAHAAAASQPEAEAGTEAALRSWSPLRVAQAIAALGGAGPTIELAYNEVTSNVTVSATTEAGATTIVTASSVVYDGAPVVIEFECSYVQIAAADNVVFVLFDDTAGASIGKPGQFTNPDVTNVARFGCHLSRRLTPAAGARVYSIRAFRVTTNGVIGVGAGGVGNLMPGYIRILKIT